MIALYRTLRAILTHPLNASHRWDALVRYIKWQMGSRLVPGAVLVPFVNQTYLLISPGMTGATQQVYTGLSDFADCSLLLHLLRKDDLFVDIGANVGVYTVLAAGALGARVVSIEPVPQAFNKLTANLRVNDIVDKVTPHNIGLGRAEGSLRFTSNQDTANHVVEDNAWSGPSVLVPVSTLDTVLNGDAPVLIKIDVEGWESEVLAGAEATLRRSSLLGLIVEMNGEDPAMSENERRVHDGLLHHGFSPYSYNPLTRSLHLLPSKSLGTNNTIYLRNVDRVSALVTSAPPFGVNGRSF